MVEPSDRDGESSASPLAESSDSVHTAIAHRRYHPVRWGQVHITEVGGTGPTIICLHQTPRSGDEFAEFMSLMAPSHRLLAIDLPGMGASDAHPGGARIESYAAAVCEVIDSISEQVVLLGHHTGGVVAIETFRLRPANVSHLVLSSTPWVGPEERRRRSLRVPIDTVDRASDGTFLLDLWNQRAPLYPAGEPTFLTRFIGDALRVTDPADGHHAVDQYQMEDRFPLPARPTLLLVHDRDPHSTAHTDAMRLKIPNAVVHHLTEGVVPFEATAAESADAVWRFLASKSAQPGARVPTDVVIRRATIDDAGPIFTVQRAAYVTEAQRYENALLAPLTQTLDEVRDDLATAWALTAEVAGRIVGSVRWSVAANTAHIGRLAVAPDMQRRGIGSRLLAAAETNASVGVGQFELFTAAESLDNIALYERHGYRIFKLEGSDPVIACLRKPCVADSELQSRSITD